MTETVILIAFVGLQTGFHLAPRLFNHLAHIVWVQRLGKHGWIVWLIHPSVLHGLQDYMIHFVIYSGRVIGGH